MADPVQLRQLFQHLIKNAIKFSGDGPPVVHVAEDGIEAMNFLRRTDGYADALRPDLVLLDLDMPRMDGREVLKKIEEDPDLRRIPVDVPTISETEQDVLDACGHSANANIVKPVDLAQFPWTIRSLEDFWPTLVRLPPANG